VHSVVIPMIRHFMILGRQEIAASSFHELQSRFSTNTSGPLSPIRMSARNFLKPHQAFDLAGLENRAFAREQYSDSKFAGDRLVSKGYADKGLAHYKKGMSCCIPDR
jgi:hypothetical protein